MLFNKKRVLSPKCSPKQDDVAMSKSGSNPPKIVHRTATRTHIDYQQYMRSATKTSSEHHHPLGLLPKSSSMALESPHSSLEGAVLKTLLKQGGVRNTGIVGGNGLHNGSHQPSNSSSTLTRTKQSITTASVVLKRQNFTPVPSLSNKKRHCSPSQTLHQQLSSLEKQSSSYNLSQLNSRKELVATRGTLTPSASFIVRTPCTADRQQIRGKQIRQTAAATATDDRPSYIDQRQREETTTDERLLEMDFSLPDELHYQQLDECTAESTSILQPVVQQSTGIFQSRNLGIGQKVSIGCSPLSIDQQQKFLQSTTSNVGANAGTGGGGGGSTGSSGKRKQLVTKSLNFNPRKLFTKDTQQQSGVLRRGLGSFISKNNSHNSKSPHDTITLVSSTGASQHPSSTCFFPAGRSITNNNSTTPPSNTVLATANRQYQQQGKMQQKQRATTTMQQRQPQLSSCSGNSTKMSQKIIQLLKSSEVLRSAAQTPGVEPSLKGLETATTTKRVPYNSKMRKLTCSTTAKKNSKLTTVPKCQVNLICNTSSVTRGDGLGKINHHAYSQEKRSTQLSPSISSPGLQQTLKPIQSLQLPLMSSAAPVETPSVPPTMQSFLENTSMRAASRRPFEDEDQSATPVSFDKSPFGEPVEEEIQLTSSRHLYPISSLKSHRKSQVLLKDSIVGTPQPIKSSFRQQHLNPEGYSGALPSPRTQQKRQQVIGLSPLNKWRKSASNKQDGKSSGKKAHSSLNNDRGGDFTPSQDGSKKATLLMNLQKIDTAGQVYQAAPPNFNSNSCFFSGNQVVANSTIPKKEGDSGLESIEDPSPVTPKSITTFTQQQKIVRGAEDSTTIMDLPSQPCIQLDKKAQSQQEDKSTPSGNQGFIDTDNSQKLKPYLRQVKRQILEQQQCLNTDPGNNHSAHGDKICRVITFEGHEVIGEASELTKSMSNVLLCGNGGRPSDFTKHLLAYEEKRQQQEQQVMLQPMPFEIAESQRDKPPYQKSQASLLFADNRILFDEISQLPSEVQGLSQKESSSITGMLGMLQQQPATSTTQASTAAAKKQQQQARRYPAMKKSNSQLVFRGDSDVMSRREGNPSIVHQLRQTYAMSTYRRSSTNNNHQKQHQQHPFAQQQRQAGGATAANQASMAKSFERQKSTEGGRTSQSQAMLQRKSDGGNGRRQATFVP